ncbi:MAG: NADH-quinone oxidoreductase subunit K [Alphaproteobacteria bacterium]
MTATDLYALTGMALFVLGAAGTVLRAHLIRRVLGLNIMGSGAFVVFGALAARGIGPAGAGGPPDPVPQALAITGIVVTAAMTALALALVVRLRTVTGRLTIDEPSSDGSAGGA